MGSLATVFQAEITAITDAMRWWMEWPKKENFQRITIFSDSRAALMAIGSSHVRSKTVWDCQKLINQANQKIDIHLNWIKGHNGTTGNEIADALAKEGAQKAQDHILATYIPMAIVKNRIHSNLQKRWQEEWSKTKTCHHTKIFSEAVTDTALPDKILSLSRPQLRRIVGWVTGFYKLNKYLFLIGQSESPHCQWCGEAEENPAHFTLECERTEYL